jgi:hypothetical protein
MCILSLYCTYMFRSQLTFIRVLVVTEYIYSTIYVFICLCIVLVFSFNSIL